MCNIKIAQLNLLSDQLKGRLKKRNKVMDGWDGGGYKGKIGYSDLPCFHPPHIPHIVEIISPLE